jgi:Flp pilus assembly protein TadD
MADYWYGREDYNQSQAFAERAKSVQPSHADLRNLLGNIYLKLGQPEKALEEYSAAVQLAPNRPDFLVNLQSIQKPK